MSDEFMIGDTVFGTIVGRRFVIGRHSLVNIFIENKKKYEEETVHYVVDSFAFSVNESALNRSRNVLFEKVMEEFKPEIFNHPSLD